MDRLVHNGPNGIAGLYVLYFDCADVDVLLGEPIQAEISAHTGIELAYDSLATISLGKVKLLGKLNRKCLHKP